MQNFKTYTDNEQLNTAVMGILDSLKTTLSNSSGTAFPTTNLQAGMFCYRTDLNALYILKDVAINEWVKTIDFANPFGNAQTAQTAQTAISATSANSATIADKLKTARTISLNGGVTGACSFDGSADVAMQVANLDATKLSGVATINTTGNASTADKLSIARKINGTPFDGSANISFGILEPIQFAAGVDLNTVMQAGMYRCYDYNYAQTVLNSPTSFAFSLLVERTSGTDARKQTLTECIAPGKTFFRKHIDGAWSPWYHYIDSTNIASQNVATVGGKKADNTNDNLTVWPSDGKLTFPNGTQFWIK